MVSRGAIRGRRGHRSGRAVRRPHQELALSRLAHHLDRRPAGGDRGGVEQRLLPRRRRQQAAAALGRARCSTPPLVRAETAAIREAFLRKRRILGDGLRDGGRALRPRARGNVLLVGRRLGAAAVAQYGDDVLPARARAPGDLRAGRVLRREPRQAPERAAVAVPELRAVLVRAGGAGGGGRGAADSGDGAGRELSG